MTNSLPSVSKSIYPHLFNYNEVNKSYNCKACEKTVCATSSNTTGLKRHLQTCKSFHNGVEIGKFTEIDFQLNILVSNKDAAGEKLQVKVPHINPKKMSIKENLIFKKIPFGYYLAQLA